MPMTGSGTTRCRRRIGLSSWVEPRQLCLLILRPMQAMRGGWRVLEFRGSWTFTGRHGGSALCRACQARNAGRLIVDIVDIVDELITAGGRETRLSAADAFHEYERAIASMRADVVRALVDEGGLSLTEVAKRLKISRQAAARLYEPGPDGTKVPTKGDQRSS